MTTSYTCPACGFEMSQRMTQALCPSCGRQLVWDSTCNAYFLLRGGKPLKAGLPEDPQVELEEQLTETIARQAREVLVPLAKSITAENAQRVLGPMSSLVMTYNNAIAELATDFEARPKKKNLPTYSGGGGMTEYITDSSETFGAQAIQQLIPVFKELIPGLRPQGATSGGLEISRLTTSLAEARTAGESMKGIADKLEKRLDALLANEPLAVLDADGERADLDADYPLPPKLVGGLPAGVEGQDEEHADGDGPDASGGGSFDGVLAEGPEEEVGQGA